MSSTGSLTREKRPVSTAFSEDTLLIKQQGKHKPFLAFLVIFTAAFFLIVMILNFMTSSDIGRSSGLFLNTTGEISDFYYLEITPAGWTFSIWGFIYTWQILWLIYAVVGIFRRNTTDQYVYLSPETQSIFFYLLYIFNMACNLTWLFMFDRQYVGWSLVPIALLPFSLYVALVISHVRLMENGSMMIKMGMHKDIWFIRLLVQNGLAFYATWVTIATLLNFSIMLTYRAGVDMSAACTASLSILLTELIVWFILDIFVFERYTRYLFSPYIVVNFALAGSLAQNYKAGATNSILSLVLIVLALCAGITKVVMLIYRHKTRPVFSNVVSSKPNVGLA